MTLAEPLTNFKGVLLAHTSSVCPVCLQRIPAQRVQYGDEVYLEKTCPQHGFTRTVVWRGKPDYDGWRRVKEPNHPHSPSTLVENGCPFDCGLCANHRQEPCCVLLEVTQRCNLGCPVCFASAGGANLPPDVSMETVDLWYRSMLAAGGPFNIQLSGGEPGLRDDLPEIIRMGKELGFSYFQMNTNGLRIANDLAYLQSLKDAGLSVVYLQFDGTTDEIYKTIRGRTILAQKIKAIENCAKLNLGVVLVPTIVPGVNNGNIGEIIKFALANYPTVRSIHFQPVSYFGRYPGIPSNENRITNPELIQAMESQTGGLVHISDFQPKGSENSYCSFHATFIIMADGKLQPIKSRNENSCCEKSESASEALKRSKDFVVRNWVRYDPAPVHQSGSSPSLGGWDELLERARTHLFSISGMAFQDAWNLDLELLQDCCIQVAAMDGRLIPFCAYNLSDVQGRTLYRPAV